MVKIHVWFCNYFQSAFQLTKLQRKEEKKKRTITIFRGYNIATTFLAC